ncbi:MAG TPA: lipopolysaccharide transport periplasmic protein LptA [Telluria sp.]
MKKILLFLAFGALVAGSAVAERADSTKPLEIEADSATFDDVKQIRILTGNVILVRGTLILKAEKATMRTDPEGYDHLVFNAAPGGLATFRQKRDGGDLWTEGEAERIEYDSKTEIVKLFSKAKLSSLEGKTVTEQAQGAYISYDSRREFVSLLNTAAGESKPGAGRVRMVIQPSNKQPAPATPGK